MLASNVSLGLRLGPYEAMRDAGSLTSRKLAARTGLHERWVREWLRGQAAAGVIDYHGDGRFELPVESAAILADARSLNSMEAIFHGIPSTFDMMPKVEEAFRTGVGFHLDARGEAMTTTLDGVFGNWHRQALVQGALPAYDGVVEKLTAGGVAADVGCGTGVALLELAKAFPRSTFHGYDNSRRILSAAAENLAAAGVENASFHHVEEQANRTRSTTTSSWPSTACTT